MPARSLFTTMIICVVCAPFALAQPGATWLFDGGDMAFDYVQTPFPNYSGSFAASGPALPPDGQLPPGQTSGVGGGTVPVTADSLQTAFYAVNANDDGTFDVALAALRTDGEPTPGTYPVDLTTGTALFGFIDDAVSLDLPDTLDQEHLVDWLLNLPAAHKLISTSGSISVAGASADTLYGTFNGTTVDVDNIFFLVNVNDGSFALSGAEVVLDAPRPDTAPRLVAAPNPFNPMTEVSLSLPADDRVQVRVFDARGRSVRVLHQGSLAAGTPRLVWDGRDDQGSRVPAGAYLVQARGTSGWRSSLKVTLVP